MFYDLNPALFLKDMIGFPNQGQPAGWLRLVTIEESEKKVPPVFLVKLKTDMLPSKSKDEMEAFMRKLPINRHVYYEMGVTDDKNCERNHIDEESVMWIPAIAGDWDFHDLQGDERKKAIDKLALRFRFDEEIAPSHLVFTTRGLQPIWFLPQTKWTPEVKKQWTEILYCADILSFAASDRRKPKYEMGFDPVCSAAHLFRMPGTIHQKTQKVTTVVGRYKIRKIGDIHAAIIEAAKRQVSRYQAFYPLFEEIIKPEPIELKCGPMEEALKTAEKEVSTKIENPQPEPASLPPSSLTLCQKIEKAKEWIKAAAFPAIQGKSGQRTALHVAHILRWGFDLPAENVADLLESDYNSKCQPPWNKDEIADLRAKAHLTKQKNTSLGCMLQPKFDQEEFLKLFETRVEVTTDLLLEGKKELTIPFGYPDNQMLREAIQGTPIETFYLAADAVSSKPYAEIPLKFAITSAILTATPFISPRCLISNNEISSKEQGKRVCAIGFLLGPTSCGKGICCELAKDVAQNFGNVDPETDCSAKVFLTRLGLSPWNLFTSNECAAWFNEKHWQSDIFKKLLKSCDSGKAEMSTMGTKECEVHNAAVQFLGCAQPNVFEFGMDSWKHVGLFARSLIVSHSRERNFRTFVGKMIRVDSVPVFQHYLQHYGSLGTCETPAPQEIRSTSTDPNDKGKKINIWRHPLPNNWMYANQSVKNPLHDLDLNEFVDADSLIGFCVRSGMYRTIIASLMEPPKIGELSKSATERADVLMKMFFHEQINVLASVPSSSIEPVVRRLCQYIWKRTNSGPNDRMPLSTAFNKCKVEPKFRKDIMTLAVGLEFIRLFEEEIRGKKVLFALRGDKDPR